MKREKLINWALSTLGIIILTAIIGLGIITPFHIDSIGMGIKYEFAFKLISSIALVEIMFLGLKECLKHNYPEGHKSSKAMIIVGWLLVVVFCIGLLADAYLLITDMMPFARIWEYSGIGILFPGVFFSWWYYFTKCGPTYIQPKWKRYLKAFLLVLVTLIIISNFFTFAAESWICVGVIYVLMLVIVAMQTDFTPPIEQSITEDIDL